MEVNCLTLKDLINPRQPRLDFAIEDGENAQKVSALRSNVFSVVISNSPKCFNMALVFVL